MDQKPIDKSDNKMYSFGYTALVTRDNEDWINKFTNEIFEIEDSFSNLLLPYEDQRQIEIKTKPPFYKYLINYLLWIYQKKLGIDKKDIGEKAAEIFAAIENGENNDLLESLADYVYEDFSDNGLSNKDQENFDRLDFAKTMKNKELKPINASAYVRSGIKKDILISSNLQRKKMLVLSFGLNMDLDTTNVFLKKVLGEEGLNFWDEEEFLIYVCKKFYDGRIDEYFKLKEVYANVEAQPILSQDLVDKEKTYEILDIFREFIEKSRDDDSLNIEKILAAYKYISQNKTRQRTIEERFINSYKNVESKLAYDIISSKDKFVDFAIDNSNSESEYSYVNDDALIFRGDDIEYKEEYKIRIYPNLGKTVKIKKGDEFFGELLKTNMAVGRDSWAQSLGNLDAKGKGDFIIKADKNYQIKAEDYLQMDIRVNSDEPFEKNPKSKFIYHKEGARIEEDLIDPIYYGLNEENLNPYGKNYYEAFINCKIKASETPIEFCDIIKYGKKKFMVLDNYPRLNYLEITAYGPVKKAKLEDIDHNSKAKFTFWSDNEDIARVEFVSYAIKTSYKENMLSYLYNKKALTAFNTKYLEKLDLGSKKYEDFYQMLKGNKITQTYLSKLGSKKDSLSPDRIKFINILFLESILDAEERYASFTDEEKIQKVPAHARKASYIRFMNYELSKVGMYEYNLSNSYEDLLARIACTNEALETYRQVWGLYDLIEMAKKEKDKKGKANE